MTNRFPWRMSIIRAVRFAAAMAILLWPVSGWAQDDLAATFKPNDDQKFEARSVPAKVASEADIRLLPTCCGSTAATNRPDGETGQPEPSDWLPAAKPWRCSA